MLTRTVVTVDGLAGSGKTSLSRHLAVRLGYAHLNSGLLYRAVGLLALIENIDLSDEEAVSRLIPSHKIDLRLGSDQSSEVYIDGKHYKSEIYAPDVSRATSICSSFGSVRSALVTAQRQAFGDHNLVAEGRDMGTVIFPDAPVKFFVVADVDVRVQRRLAQYNKDRPNLTEKELKDLELQVKSDLIERDERDSSRQASPTKPAEDAIIVDNSAGSLTQVVENMYAAVANRG